MGCKTCDKNNSEECPGLEMDTTMSFCKHEEPLGDDALKRIEVDNKIWEEELK